MERKTEQILRILNFCACVFGFLCYLVAFLTTSWSQYSEGGHVVSYGLFFSCASTRLRTECGILDKGFLNDTYRTSQGFAVLTLLIYMAAAVSSFFLLLFCQSRCKKRLLLFVSVSTLATCVFLGICIAMFISFHEDDISSFGYSFYLAVGSGGMAPIVTILSFLLSRVNVVAKKKTLDYGTQIPPLSTHLNTDHTNQNDSGSLPPVEIAVGTSRVEITFPVPQKSKKKKKRQVHGLEPMFRYKKSAGY